MEKLKVKKEKAKPRNYFDVNKSWNNSNDYFRRDDSKSFDEKMRFFMKESDEKLSEIKKNIEAKRT